MSKPTRPRIYIAGPYSKPDPILNTKVAIGVADSLQAMGYTPFVPHLTALWHLVSPKPIKFWYDYDQEWLVVCDVFYRIPGESPGAALEELLAYKKGIEVITSLEEAQYFIKKWREDGSTSTH